ncbi:hypothetical protein ACIPSA_47190 [Streptomyces sp. NPDC086549]|uniref:hypothetical protein n=1 Tax=Streptomyces sp. NPDC086549 TaxID=3365752 RepID=UPI003829479B
MLKCFDAAANPYLLIGAVLATGLAGLEAGHSLPPETVGDPAALDTAERLPASLPAAIDAFEKSAVLREALGPELHEAVLAVRRAEAELFAMFTDADVIEAVRWRY